MDDDKTSTGPRLERVGSLITEAWRWWNSITEEELAELDREEGSIPGYVLLPRKPGSKVRMYEKIREPETEQA